MSEIPLSSSLLHTNDLTEWFENILKQGNNISEDNLQASLAQKYEEAVVMRDTFEQLSDEDKVTEAQRRIAEARTQLNEYFAKKSTQLLSLSSKKEELSAIYDKTKDKELKDKLGRMLELLKKEYKNFDDLSTIKDQIASLEVIDLPTMIEQIKKIDQTQVDIAKQALAKFESANRYVDLLMREFKRCKG